MERTRKRPRSASVNARRKKRPTLPGAVNSDSMDLMYEGMEEDLVGVMNGDKLVTEDLERQKKEEEKIKEQKAQREKAQKKLSSELQRIRAEQEGAKQVHDVTLSNEEKSDM